MRVHTPPQNLPITLRSDVAGGRQTRARDTITLRTFLQGRQVPEANPQNAQSIQVRTALERMGPGFKVLSVLLGPLCPASFMSYAGLVGLVNGLLTPVLPVEMSKENIFPPAESTRHFCLE